MGSVRRRHSGFTLIELMITVAILGILASVAIPAYIKYIYRTRTVEATMNLRTMYDGAVAYYVSEHSDPGGNVLQKQFPIPAGPTPPAVPGFNAGDVGLKHKPTAVEWKSSGWAALDFQISDWYSYQYTFSTLNAPPTQTAVMTANGDLDGDGILSTFQRHAIGNHDQIMGDPALYSDKETE
jgi:prepilin-type N-terminal cleavage/methylation domain-containing protein